MTSQWEDSFLILKLPTRHLDILVTKASCAWSTLMLSLAGQPACLPACLPSWPSVWGHPSPYPESTPRDALSQHRPHPATSQFALRWRPQQDCCSFHSRGEWSHIYQANYCLSLGKQILIKNIKNVLIPCKSLYRKEEVLQIMRVN